MGGALMTWSRLQCATCDERIDVCATCGAVGCPDPACFGCVAERYGLPHNALLILKQSRQAALQFLP